MLSKIPTITCPQHLPSSPSYSSAANQYASATLSKTLNVSPGLIVEARCMDDISRTVQFAKKNNLAIATRSGGLSWGAFSSTTPSNIQLDVSRTFRGAEDQKIFTGADGATYMRASVSHSLGEFNDFLAKKKCFVPHGQCDRIFLGGHVQTGGYGQLARSFGLLGDHVVALEMVDANGDVVTVTKKSDPERFFGVLGGSPGNLGVLTHVTMKVYRDEEYEGAKGLKVVYAYTPETLEKLLDELVVMSENGDSLARGYDLSVHVGSDKYPVEDLCRGMEGAVPECATISIFAQWVPFEEEEKPDMAWFTRLATAAEPLLSSGVQELPMSTLTRQWLSLDREFDLPYQKKLYTSNSTNFTQNNWSTWTVNRVNEITTSKADLHLYARFQYIGGSHSQFAANAHNGTAYSWRDTTMLALLECFHDSSSSEAKDAAADWQRVNDREAIGPNGVFCEQDRRLVWNCNGNPNLDATWKCYFEDREKYERLQRIRVEADPQGTFTANTFAVKRADGAERMVVPVAMNTGAAEMLARKVEVVGEALVSN